MDPSSAPQDASPDVPAGPSPADSAAPVTPDAPVDQGVTPAEPPAADPAGAEGEPKSLADAIAGAVAEKPKADAEPAKPAEKPTTPDPAAKQKTAEEQAAEDAKLPFGKHPRWKQVMGENQELRRFRDSVAPKVQDYDKIVGFMRDNQISPEEMQGLYALAAMMKNEPVRALETLRQMIDPLERFVGDKLPDDLATEVEEGVIPEQRAKEIARLRNTGKFQQERAEREADQSARQAQAEIRRAQAEAVTAWEAQVKSADPDYPVYQEWVVLELQRLNAAAPARNPAEALALAKQAYTNVRAKFQGTLRRGMPEVPRGPSSQNVPGSNGRLPAPGNMLEAIQQAL